MNHEIETTHPADMKMTVDGLIPRLGRGFYFFYILILAVAAILVAVLISLFVFPGSCE